MTRSILFVINGTDYGGTESVVSQMASGFCRRGHDVRVLSLKPLGRMGHRLARTGVEVESLEMPESVGAAALVTGCLRLARVFRQRRPDIIHSHMPRANVMSRLSLKLAGLSATHVSSEHSTDARRRTTVTLLNRYTGGWTDRILAVSTEVKETLVSRERVPARKVTVLPNGIDVELIDTVSPVAIRTELGLEECRVVLCSAGRLVRDKGHVYLIRAIARMAAKDRVHLLLVGDGPEQARLRSEAAAHGLSARVHFLGYRNDLLGILKAIDVFVLPSLEEGIPLVILEAMACGRPVVATDVGGIRALVIPDRTGVVVPPAEIWMQPARALQLRQDTNEQVQALGVRALAEALDRLVVGPSSIAEMGQRARRTVEDQFALNRILDRLEKIYDRLLASRRSRVTRASLRWRSSTAQEPPRA